MGRWQMALAGAAALAALGTGVPAAVARADQGMQSPPERMGAPGNRGGWSVADRLARMTDRLGLNEAQQERIRPLLEAEAVQFRKLRDDTALSQEEKRVKAREIGRGTFDRIRPILNPDQQQKLDQFREQLRERMKERQGKMPSGPPKQ